MTSSIVVLDACVLYSFAVRDLLMRLAVEGLLDRSEHSVIGVVEEQAGALHAPALSVEKRWVQIPNV